MKKFIIFIISIFMLTACGSVDGENIKKDFTDKVSNLDSYSIVGRMKIISDEEVFNYNIDVNFLKDNNYKVKLLNVSNNHEQVILRNSSGVYVITPSINKSYKFESSWPDNSSQSYLLKSLLKDINYDKKSKVTKSKSGYIIKTKVNYPNNENLSYEKIYIDKDANVTKVVVYDSDNKKRIETIFDKIDYKTNLKEDSFKIDDYIKKMDENKENKCEGEDCSKNTANLLDDIIYPLYLPSNTYLTSSEKIDSENGKRVILTFEGDKSFTIVEETLSIPKEFEINPVFGDPILLNDTLGVMEDNSIRWNKAGVSYYLTSNTLSGSEMVSVASSMNEAKSVLGSK